MKKYTHTFDICFSVNSDYSDETDCLRLEKNEVISASQGRIRNVFNDNESIANVTDNTSWNQSTSGAYAWYNNDEICINF